MDGLFGSVKHLLAVTVRFQLCSPPAHVFSSSAADEDSINGAGGHPADDPLALTSNPPKAQPANVILSTTMFFLSIWFSFPALSWKWVLIIALSLFLICFVAILYLFHSPRYQHAAMTGVVHTSDVAANSDLLLFPGNIGEDGNPQAPSFSL